MFLDRWTIVRCKNCGHISVYYTYSQNLPDSRFEGVKLVCPKCKHDYEVVKNNKEDVLNSELMTMMLTEELIHRNRTCTMDIPRELNKIMLRHGVSEKDRTKILFEFGILLFN